MHTHVCFSTCVWVNISARMWDDVAQEHTRLSCETCPCACVWIHTRDFRTSILARVVYDIFTLSHRARARVKHTRPEARQDAVIRLKLPVTSRTHNSTSSKIMRAREYASPRMVQNPFQIRRRKHVEPVPKDQENRINSTLFRNVQ